MKVPNNTWKGAQYNLPVGKHKLKPQWEATLSIMVAEIKKTDNSNCWWGCGEGNSCIAGKTVKGYNHVGKQFGGFFKV